MTRSASKCDRIPNAVVDRCGSTNDLARQLGEAGHPHGTWISARAQEGGRGRLGRVWESRGGNLFLSLVARPRTEFLTWVPLAAAVAVVRVIRETFPGVDARIKWPNDVWIFRDGRGAKAGGILCESVGTQSGSFVVIGIGLNCADSPSGLDQEATSVTEALSAIEPVTADAVRGPVIAAILEELARLEAGGTEEIRRSYEAWAVFARGSEVQWTEKGVRQTGRVQGLGAYGELLVEPLEDGDRACDGVTPKRLFAEDVSIRGARPSLNE